MLSSRPVSLAVLVSLLALSLGACGKKDPTPKPKVDPPTTTAPKPKEEPKPDPMIKAKKEADNAAVLAAVNRRDRVVEVAGAMEALTKKVDTTPTTTPRVVRRPKGRIDAKDASKVFSKYNGGMQRCYERALKRSPGLEGKMRLRLRVNRSGKVSSARTQGLNMRSSVVSKCMEQLARRMTFPKPKGGDAEIAKTYAFRPQI